jgi:tRNA(adenine34) deaminase
MKNVDEKNIRKCINLSEKALENGDMPFGCVITKGDEIIAESVNLAHTDGSILDHAEILAIKEALTKLGTKKLPECTIYSNSEPCPMCSFMIRELQFRKVVFSLLSPDVGGYTKWKILQDPDLHVKFPNYYNSVPEIVVGILKDEASVVWKKRNEMRKLVED